MALVATLRLFQYALLSLRDANSDLGNALVVNKSSLDDIVNLYQSRYGIKSKANSPFYCLVKTGLLVWSRVAACEFRSEGIREKAISQFSIHAEPLQEVNREILAKLAGRIPLVGIGLAMEVQVLLSSLISDDSSFVNGANLSVGGGWAC